MDIDGFSVLTGTDAKSNSLGIDLWIGHNQDEDSINLGSTLWASLKDFPSTRNWNGYYPSFFKEICPKINMKNITQSQLRNLWDSGVNTFPRRKLAEGNQYMTVTNMGAIAIFEIKVLEKGQGGRVVVDIGKTDAGLGRFG